MSRDKASICDMIQAIEDIQQCMDRVSFEILTNNREKQAAILYFFIIIGEATKRLSPELRASHPDINWEGMAGMRDILAHQYDRINVRVVWDVVQTDLSQLLELLQTLLKNLK